MNKNTAIAYCHTGTVCHPFMQSIVDLSYYDVRHHNHVKAIIAIGDAYIPNARNLVVNKFLGLSTEIDWLLFFDHDMVFVPGFVDQMLDMAEMHPDKLIIGALYFNYLDDKKLWSTWMEETPIGKFTTVGQWEPNSFKKLSACGMGGTLIHRSVFERIKAQYQDDPWIWYGHDILDVGRGKPERIGEDLTFCWRAKQVGIQTWGYTGITLGHMKMRMEDMATFIQQPWVHQAPADQP